MSNPTILRKLYEATKDQPSFSINDMREHGIHNDFEKGFIRAETISYDDYLSCNGEQGAKEAGKMRLEGKEYIVREGDVMHFRFNV